MPFIGEIKMFCRRFSPQGFLLCDGRSLDKREYKKLYEVIQGIYGETKSEFNLPDFRNRFPLQASSNTAGTYDLTLGKTGGSNYISISEEHLPAHNHGVEMQFSSSAAMIPDARDNFLSSTPKPTSIGKQIPEDFRSQGAYLNEKSIIVATAGKGAEINIQNPYLELSFEIFSGIY
jgi:microcystin-dependent protein